jgi:hypothetical protein
VDPTLDEQRPRALEDRAEAVGLGKRPLDPFERFRRPPGRLREERPSARGGRERPRAVEAPAVLLELLGESLGAIEQPRAHDSFDCVGKDREHGRVADAHSPQVGRKRLEPAAGFLCVAKRKVEEAERVLVHEQEEVLTGLPGDRGALFAGQPRLVHLPEQSGDKCPHAEDEREVGEPREAFDPRARRM